MLEYPEEQTMTTRDTDKHSSASDIERDFPRWKQNTLTYGGQNESLLLKVY